MKKNIALRYLELEPEAMTVYSELIASNKDSAPVYARLGNAYYSREMYDRAIEDYNKALALDPEALATYNNRGMSYLRSNNLHMAVLDFKKACDSGIQAACKNLEMVVQGIKNKSKRNAIPH